MSQARRRHPILLVAVLALVLAVCGAACSSSDGGSSTTSSGGGSGEESSGTVEIEHRYGTTEVPVDPQRVVALDAQWVDVLIAMEHAPIGYIPDPAVPDGFPWRGDALADAEPLEATTVLPYEAIAALDPDLIVVSYLVQTEQDYETLSAIAPTIPSLGELEVGTWQDMTEVAGRIYDDPDAAQEIIDGVDAEVTAVADELPGLQGKTAALVNLLPSELIVVADPSDGANLLFAQLGMSIPEAIIDANKGGVGRVTLSMEQAGLIDADLLLLLPNGNDPAQKIPGWAELTAVESGAVDLMDYAGISGLNTPSPLSIPYSLELIRPALAAAAAA